jgi:hypothetical protein
MFDIWAWCRALGPLSLLKTAFFEARSLKLGSLFIKKVKHVLSWLYSGLRDFSNPVCGWLERFVPAPVS